MRNKWEKKDKKILVFVHDHKFIMLNDGIYSPGGLSNEVLSRYTKYFDKLLVIARIVVKKETSQRYSKITNEKIDIIDGRELSRNSFKAIIQGADGLIIRLPSVLGLRSAFYALRNKKKYIVELVGSAWDAYWFHSLKGKLVAGPITVLTKIIVYFSNHIIFVTTQYLQKKYYTKGLTVGISNVYLERLEQIVLEQRIEKIRRRTENQKLILASIGSLDMKYKGHQYVIKAIKDLQSKSFSNIEYHLVGGGEGRYLRKLANELNLGHVVKFIGSLPHDEIFSWLDSIDVYIQPSLTEGLPRALIEAMSRGCPCLASTAGGNTELINNEYIFKKGCVEAITEHIIKLSKKENMLEQSNVNFSKSKLYEKEYLEKKREKFIHDYLQNFNKTI
jgi:glycosyltransferase involved in cell wall biosynthesis